VVAFTYLLASYSSYEYAQIYTMSNQQSPFLAHCKMCDNATRMIGVEFMNATKVDRYADGGRV